MADVEPPRVVLLVTSPRIPPGLLTAEAWDLLRTNAVVAGAESAQTAALRVAGIEVTIDPAPDLLASARTVVWLAGPAGDPDLARDVGMRLAREPGRATMELLYGSWDPPGARLLDVVTVIDQLLSSGGDPWLRAQTHGSLARYLLEEFYEAYDAIEAGDLDALREELGDLLLQVILHARLAEDQPEESRWNIDDVAGGLVDKMVRRNPHVFAGESIEAESIEDATRSPHASESSGSSLLDEITENWEQIKRAEKSRDSAFDGIAMAQPALSLAAKVMSRAERASVAVRLPDPSEGLGAVLLRAVAKARSGGLDAEAELRGAVLAYLDAARAAERAAP